MTPQDTHLACLDVIYPPRDLGFLQHEWILCQKLHIVPHRALKITELEKINRIHLLCDRSVIGMRILDEGLKVGRGEGEHAAVSVVEDCDLASAEEPLRDDDRSQGFPS
jgi:hypothetical protein